MKYIANMLENMFTAYIGRKLKNTSLITIFKDVDLLENVQ